LEPLEDRRLLNAGALDPLFGVDGMQNFDLGFGDRPQQVSATATAVDANGNILVAGYATSGSNTYGLVARFGPDGNLDTTFNSNSTPGYLELLQNTELTGIAIQPNGQIVVAGTYFGQSTNSIFVARLNSDGSSDVDFGFFGLVVYSDTTNGGSLEGGSASLAGTPLALENSGEIVVAGHDFFGGNTYFALVRLFYDGSTDNFFTFSNAGPGTEQAGMVLTAFPDGSGGSGAEALSVTIAPDGTIATAGFATLLISGNFQQSWAVALYNDDGTPDADFNAVGRRTDYFGTLGEAATGIAFQPDGNIVVSGYSGGVWDILRYQPDGTLDASFGNGGVVTTSFPNGSVQDVATALALQPDGKIVVAGYSYDGAQDGNFNFALGRYNPDGSLDTTFSFDGLVTTDLFGAEQNDLGTALALQPDGRIVVVGDSQDQFGNNIIGLARYNGDSGQLQLSAPTVSMVESAGSVTLTVTRTGGATGSVTVDYATSDGTATANADYTPVSGTLIFNVGQTSQTIVIPILDDGTLEGGSENLYVTLSNPTGGAVLGDQTYQEVVINDADTASVNPTEGQAFSGVVARFKGSNPNVAAGDYSATINWGDNTTTPGIITSDPNGGFDISGTHLYTEEGEYAASITVTGAEKLSVNSLINVADAPLTATPINLVVVGSKNFSGPVATFTDSDPNGTLNDYSATITWDDGTTSTGTISGNGTYTVSGSHTFGLFKGVHHITVAISDAGGATTIATDSVVDPTPNELYVSHLYQQLLQRQPDAGGLAYWSNLLDHGVSRIQVALDIEQSQEYRQDEVQALYAHYLNRAADPAGLAVFTNLLAHGSTIEKVAAQIVGSAEYYQTHGDTIAGFLSALYHEALGRNIDPSGQAYFASQLAAGVSRQDIASAIFGSLEYCQDVVRSYYQALLGRSAGTTGLAIFAGALATGTRDEQVLADILASDEFFAKL
jgi:uncharacterized delta-60 repeat protein